MAYTKQTWNNGDVITADKLNHMEDGIYIAKDDNDFIIEVNYDTTEYKYIVNKSIEEIDEAFTEGKELRVKIGNRYCSFVERTTSMAGYSFHFAGMFSDPVFEDATQVSISFYSCFISPYDDIKVIIKPASLSVS